MNTKHSSTQAAPEMRQSHEALFNAPGWAAKMLTIAATLGMMAVVSLAVGIGLAIAASNVAPVVLGVVLSAFCALPAVILRSLTMRSLGAMYEAPKVAPVGPEQTVIFLERGLNVAGKRTDFGRDRITVNAPGEEVSRMMDWLKANPDKTSRAQVMANARVKQTTWERVMAALEEVGAVEGGGKSGYTVTDTLDDKLSRLDARL